MFHGFGTGLGALALLPDLLRNLDWNAERMRAALEPSMYATDLAVDLARAGRAVPRCLQAGGRSGALGAKAIPQASLAARVSPGAAGDLRLDLLRDRLRG